MYVDKWNKIAVAAQQRRRQKPRYIASSWLFVVPSFVAVAHIYRKGPHKIKCTVTD
jgi:hypothetical protein